MKISRIEQLVERIEKEDPELLLGADSYVLSCADQCPTNLPCLVVAKRMSHLANIREDILTDELMNMYEPVLRQVRKWIATLELNEVPQEARGVVLDRTEDGVRILFGDALSKAIQAKGFNVDTYLSAINDQLLASTAQAIEKRVAHVHETHPGVVSCGGSVEKAGKMLCGATISTNRSPNPAAKEMVMLSVRRTIESESK